MSQPSPSTPPQWGTDYFSDAPAPAGHKPLGRGLVGHVQPVAAVMLVVGVLEGAFAVFAFFGAIAVFYLPAESGTNATGLAILIGIVGIPAAICSVLRIVAGFYNMRFRKRKLGMIALIAGLATVFTGYCAPTSVALAVWGLIVYLNDSATVAFELGDRGKTSAEVHAAFPP